MELQNIVSFSKIKKGRKTANRNDVIVILDEVTDGYHIRIYVEGGRSSRKNYIAISKGEKQYINSFTIPSEITNARLFTHFIEVEVNSIVKAMDTWK